MCQIAQSIVCLTAPSAFLCPRRGLSRRYWALRWWPLTRIAAMAASSSAKSSHSDPLRVLPERRLPADWSLPGQRPGPGREVPRGRELGHVGADLGEDALRAAALDAGHRAQQFNRRRERADLFLDHAGELFDLLVEEIDVAQDRADPQPVMGVEVSGERLAQGGDLLAHLPPRQFGEDRGIGLAGDERVEHVAPGLAHDVCRDGVELDAGVFERLV